MCLDQSYLLDLRDVSYFRALICFHNFCLFFYNRQRCDFAIELHVGLDQTSLFLFQKNLLVGMLLHIDLY